MIKYMIHLVAFSLTLTFLACEGEEIKDTIDKVTEKTDVDMDAGVDTDAGVVNDRNDPYPDCEYPKANIPMVNNGDVIAPLVMKNGFLPGNKARKDFSMRAFYCDEKYKDYSSLVMIVFAQHCPACGPEMERVFPMAAELEANGAYVLFLVGIDYITGVEIYSRTATDYVTSHVEKDFAYRIGGKDIDNWLYDQNTAEGAISIVGWPTDFLIRKSDMKLVQSSLNQDYLDFVSLTAAVQAEAQ